MNLGDRALILLGWATAMRKSELVALDVEDLVFGTKGLVVTIHRTKTDEGLAHLADGR